MTAKVPKCHCLTTEGSSGKVVDPQLVIDSHPIPFILNKSINFKVKVPSDASGAKQELKARLKHLLQAVDGCLVTVQAGYLSKAELAPNNLQVPNNVVRERVGFDDDKVPEEVGGPGQVSQH